MFEIQVVTTDGKGYLFMDCDFTVHMFNQHKSIIISPMKETSIYSFHFKDIDYITVKPL